MSDGVVRVTVIKQVKLNETCNIAASVDQLQENPVYPAYTEFSAKFGLIESRQIGLPKNADFSNNIIYENVAVFTHNLCNPFLLLRLNLFFHGKKL